MKETINHYQAINNYNIANTLDEIYLNNPGYSREIHHIVENAGYNCANLVKVWACIVTPYSPNLNPIERLWKVMNEYARNNRY